MFPATVHKSHFRFAPLEREYLFEFARSINISSLQDGELYRFLLSPACSLPPALLTLPAAFSQSSSQKHPLASPDALLATRVLIAVV
jgi:hypothetical protein